MEGRNERFRLIAVRHRWRLLQGLSPIDRKRIPADVLAGVTLAALGIPVMGYTTIADIDFSGGRPCMT